MCRASTSTPPAGSSGSSGGSAETNPLPAFRGAEFDRDGRCLRHREVRLAERVPGPDGRPLWREVRMTCPRCAAANHKSRRMTSLGGAGKQKSYRGIHGTANPLSQPAAAVRHRDKAFDNPFDSKGRCHHHPEVQLASKKVLGGWKILLARCPKCIEANYAEESVASGRSRRDRSVDSRRSRRCPVETRTEPVAHGAKHDANGCCTSHPAIQIARKTILGGWKECRACPKCLDPAQDDPSVGSRRTASSTRSEGTAKSARSRKSARSARSGRRRSRKGARHGMLPFDVDGFCPAHPEVRLAKKKVLQNACPECARTSSSRAVMARAQSSRRARRGPRDDGSEASSRRSGPSSCCSGRSGTSRRKKIRVKGMRYRDEHGREGRYSGDVDEDHVPHGRGKMKYRDGSVFAGVWSAGSPAHGKTTPARKARDGAGAGAKEDADGGAPKSVHRMRWTDHYGNPGEYTGEVDARTKMPEGKGRMQYALGLSQEGFWRGGRFVEGSDAKALREYPPPPRGPYVSGRQAALTRRRSEIDRWACE